MSCIEVKVKKEKGTTFQVQRIEKAMTVNVVSEIPLKARTELRRIVLSPTSQRMGPRLHISVHKICSVANFMDVTPDAVAWVDEYNDFIYNVISNTKWNVI